jgi:serine protease Do
MFRLLCSTMIVLMTSGLCLAQDQTSNKIDKKTERESLMIEGSPIQSWAPLVAKIAPAVVNLSGTISKKDTKIVSLGCGFIISKKGYIATANHVLRDAAEIDVTLPDSRRFVAKIIERDSYADLAILKFEPVGDLPVILLGDSDKLRIGDYVISVGNPFGSWTTASVGIVSALGDAGVLPGPYKAGFIMTDASINPGNGGGPLCNAAGDVVGINTGMVENEKRVGFAIPVSVLKSFIKRFIDGLVAS